MKQLSTMPERCRRDVFRGVKPRPNDSEEWIVELTLAPLLRSKGLKGAAAARKKAEMQAEHDRFLQEMGKLRAGMTAKRQRTLSTTTTRGFFVTLNGVVIRLTPEEATEVRNLPFVSRMTRVQPAQAQLTKSVPQTGAAALHAAGTPVKGKGVLVAVLDAWASNINFPHWVAGLVRPIVWLADVILSMVMMIHG